MNEHDIETLIAEALGDLIEALNEDEYADVPDASRKSTPSARSPTRAC